MQERTLTDRLFRVAVLVAFAAACWRWSWRLAPERYRPESILK